MLHNPADPQPLDQVPLERRACDLVVECGIEGLTLRKGDGLRVDLVAGTVTVFRDDDAPALLRGRIPARLQWRPRTHGEG